MRRIVYILIVLCFVSLAVKAQQQHFIYIQADNKLPFSVRLNGKYYSSSSIGYLIIPRLADGTYTFQVGFAQNSFPEQTFILHITGKDYGYALKNFDAKGWGLFNFQTTDIVMNSNSPVPENQPAAVPANNSAFGNMLADAINDSTINNVTVPDTVAGTKSPVISTPVAAIQDTGKGLPSDTSADIANNIVAGEKKTGESKDSIVTATFDSSVQNAAAFNTTGVIKASENTSDKGTDLLFIDFDSTHNDTIAAFIPAAEQQKNAVKTDTLSTALKAPVADTASKTVGNPFFDQNSTPQHNPANTTVAAQPNLIGDSVTSVVKPSKIMVNSTCTNMLSDGDLNKLKKKIISQSSQDAVLATVRKSLRDKCITTEQVKDLGNLFLNDESRYGFYDAAYPFVYDANRYPTLENTLIDNYFKNRFKALLR